MHKKSIAVYFSPTGTTEKIAINIAQNLGDHLETYDLCELIEALNLTNDDIAIVAVPVFGGRVPEHAVKAISQISGNHIKAVAVTVYGNRHYDDALLELCDLLTHQGFQIAAAGAFVARHSIIETVGEGRPNEKDFDEIKSFALKAKENIAIGLTICLDTIPGSRTYKERSPLKIPIFTSAACTNCGLCAEKCPVKVIPENDGMTTDSDKCIACMRCIHICPVHARSIATPAFERLNNYLGQFSIPRKNECYF